MRLINATILPLFLLITQAYTFRTTDSPSSLPISSPLNSTYSNPESLSNLSPNDPFNPDYIDSLLGRSTFFGSWSSGEDNLADALTSKSGYLYMHYESDGDFAFGFEVFDGQYMDQKVLTILYNNPPNNITSTDESNATLVFGSSQVDYQIGETYGQLGAISQCDVKTTVYLIDVKSGQPLVLTGNITADLNNLGVQFQVEGNQCTLDFVTSILTDTNSLFQSQGIPYFCVVLLSGFTQCIICYLLEKTVVRKEGYARRISPWSLLILNAFDLYFLLATAYFFMSYSPIYELAAIPYAFLAFLYEPRLVWRIFQIHGRRLDDRRRSRLEIQSYFGMLLLFLCLLVSLVVYPNFVYLLVAVFLAPQIKHNYNYSQRHRWNYWITFGLGFPKALFAIYSKLDPNNLLRITPDPIIVFSFISLLLLQAILLALQMRRPRFGVDEKSGYKVFISRRSLKSSQELCSICLEKLKGSFGSATQSFLDNKKAKMMILTPCGHEFHVVCLTEWLKSKLECPYCRTELPILPDDDTED